MFSRTVAAPAEDPIEEVLGRLVGATGLNGFFRSTKSANIFPRHSKNG
jgi:hypothetical protein